MRSNTYMKYIFFGYNLFARQVKAHNLQFITKYSSNIIM